MRLEVYRVNVNPCAPEGKTRDESLFELCKYIIERWIEGRLEDQQTDTHLLACAFLCERLSQLFAQDSRSVIEVDTRSGSLVLLEIAEKPAQKEAAWLTPSLN